MKAVIYGTGAVGARVARQLISSEQLSSLILIDDDSAVAEEAAVSLGDPAQTATISAFKVETRLERFSDLTDGADIVVLTAREDHELFARAALNSGSHVVSVSDDLDIVEELFKLDQLARDADKNLVIGAGFAPGLSCLLTLHTQTWLDKVDEIHISKFGTGGPACARQHHRALRSDGIEWRNQQWEKLRGGTGRELCWFPDPVGGSDCFYAALPEPILVQPAFPNAARITARVAATRRDMSTKWLPMLRRPHPEGTIGGIRVEARGWIGESRDEIVLGVLDRPAVAAGTVAAVAGIWACRGDFLRRGAGGLAELVDDPVPMLQELAIRGVRAAIFEGAST